MFESSKYTSEILEGKVEAKAPSNIALIKYWGKYTHQIPANASISYTLKKSKTFMKISFRKSNQFSLNFSFENKQNLPFENKIKNYLLSIDKYIPFIHQYHFSIDSHNTFPHSSGIASSASAFGALALGFMEIEQTLLNETELNYKKASFLARLGSGSACRSIYKGLVVWGENPFIKNSHNEYAIEYPYQVPNRFKSFQDSILLVHEGEKSISSSVGHSLMNRNPYANARFIQANERFQQINDIIKNEDIFAFGELIESEALTLHAMMLASDPSFILMKPNTLAIIERVLEYRKKEGVPLFFTLDAGANVHLLYPHDMKAEVESFIQNNLLEFTQNGKVIYDEVDFN